MKRALRHVKRTFVREAMLRIVKRLRAWAAHCTSLCTKHKTSLGEAELHYAAGMTSLGEAELHYAGGITACGREPPFAASGGAALS